MGTETIAEKEDDKKKARMRTLWSKVGNKQEKKSPWAAAVSKAGEKSNNKKPTSILDVIRLAKQQKAQINADPDLPDQSMASYAASGGMPLAINAMNAPNQGTTQCDCGYDTCPFCNLLLNMEMTDPTMLM